MAEAIHIGLGEKSPKDQDWVSPAMTAGVPIGSGAWRTLPSWSRLPRRSRGRAAVPEAGGMTNTRR